MDLVARGLKTEPIVGGLSINEIIKYLNGLGANAREKTDPGAVQLSEEKRSRIIKFCRTNYSWLDPRPRQ